MIYVVFLEASFRGLFLPDSTMGQHLSSLPSLDSSSNLHCSDSDSKTDLDADVVVKLGHDADSENNTAPSFNLKPNRRPGAGGIAGALSRVRRKSLPKDQIVPFCSVLGLDNVQDCIEVEEAFPEMERCTKEKVRGSRRAPFPVALWLTGVL